MELIVKRKNDHIALALSAEAQSTANAGFDKYRFEHNALPELNYAEIDTSVKFLGRKIDMPLMISSMTGGGEKSAKINRGLAEIANDYNICFAVGSQRIALGDKAFENVFQVKKYVPNITLLANLGAVQLNYGFSVDDYKRAVNMIEADALILHLNPLHEIFQIGGNTNFSGLLKKIENICKNSYVPVIVKEVGYGISANVAKKLQSAGVFAVDIAGAGSVSWSNIESLRGNDVVVKNAAKTFADWGIPTTECVRDVAANVNNIAIIASGGVKNGLDMAKSIALGADICGNASTFLKGIIESRAECENYMETLKMELKTVMFCTGSKNIKELKTTKLNKIY